MTLYGSTMRHYTIVRILADPKVNFTSCHREPHRLVEIRLVKIAIRSVQTNVKLIDDIGNL
jgi:hypothetical protein